MALRDRGRAVAALLFGYWERRLGAAGRLQEFGDLFFARKARYAACCMHTVKAIYPGTFDPLTNGHLDLIARGSKIVDELVVAILRNSEKGTPLFTVPEREEMIFEATRSFGNVSVTTFNGLLVDFARQQGAKAVLRGIRAISDYEYEFQMAMMNRKLDPELETLFMMPAEKYTYVSSRLIKGVFQLGGDVTALVPPLVVERLKAKVPNQVK
jgi:pantetheine-phosphate adenylyltransferase